jgi:hypothetical protein
MATATDFAARGKVTKVLDGKVVFSPANTNYEMHLAVSKPYTGPLNEPIDAVIRVKARKIYTVPSGGGFITPLFGPPKIVQGRALLVEAGSVIIRAGTPIVVELPQADTSIDLSEGQISVGSIVNAVILPGATFELIGPAVRQQIAQNLPMFTQQVGKVG